MRDNFKNVVKSVAKVIRKHGQITRREIAAILPVSIMTVGKAVDYLFEIGMISQSVLHTSGTGRKAGILSLSEKYCIVIDISVRNFTLELFDISGKRIAALTHHYSNSALFEENLYIFFDRAKAFCESKKQNMDLLGVGLIIPGRYDSVSDRVECAGNMDFIGVNPSALLKETFHDMPTFVTEDIMMGAAWAAECFEQYKNLLYIKALPPLGAVVVADGKMWKGIINGLGFSAEATDDKLYEYMSYIEKARLMSRAVAGYMTVFRPDAVVVDRSDFARDDGMAETMTALITGEFSVRAELCPRIISFASDDNAKKKGILTQIFENWLDKTVK